ncbi:MAG: erythromycin biosynthesis sensory transduction protein eryC1 [Acidobacteria bacterium]|nr:MAG: erythromycin biosynthesis sensory transduction protein eryC1 [Acidobacteriota bacterium]
MNVSSIPFLDLVSPHVELEGELTEIFRRVLRSAGFIGGALVEEFENAFARFCEAEHCIGAANGTDALRFALIAAGVKAGDVVVTVPNTFIATAEAISQAAALPEFADIDERTYNMNPESLRRYLTERCEFADGKLVSMRSGRPVTAIVPVHLYGQMADMDAIVELAQQFNLLVVEDACQAHGAKYFSRRENTWKTAGSIGRAAAFSFYPGKNLGACGEAGAVTTSDPEIARTIRMLRDHGQAKKYYHDIEGYNGRLDALQAGLLGVKLKHLPDWNARRQALASEYRDLLSMPDSSIAPPFEPGWSKAVYHLFVVRVENRDQFQRDLAEAGIGTGIHYPVPLHQQKAYTHLGYQTGDFPITELAAPQIVSLPMFPQMTSEQLERVVAVAQQSVTVKAAAAVAR